MTISGKVHEIGALQQVSETFKKRDLIIEYAENELYPEFIKFDTIQDKTELLNKVKVGDVVDVHFNLRGKPYTDKTGKTSYFNNLSIWRINPVSSAPEQAPQSAPPADDSEPLPF